MRWCSKQIIHSHSRPVLLAAPSTTFKSFPGVSLEGTGRGGKLLSVQSRTKVVASVLHDAVQPQLQKHKERSWLANSFPHTTRDGSQSCAALSVSWIGDQYCGKLVVKETLQFSLFAKRLWELDTQQVGVEMWTTQSLYAMCLLSLFQ